MLVWKQATCQWCWWYLFVMRASNIVRADGFLTIAAITITISSLVASTLLRSFYFETKMKRKRTNFYYFYYNFYDWNVFRPLGALGDMEKYLWRKTMIIGIKIMKTYLRLSVVFSDVFDVNHSNKQVKILL